VTTKKQIEAILSDCRVDHLYTTPVNFDWSAHEAGDVWEFWEAVRCDKCNTPVVVSGGGGGQTHNDFDYEVPCTGLLRESEGPMMSYWYPCKIDDSDFDEMAIKIIDLPLCIVRVNDNTGLALTGGGMDLTWEICAAYLKCGYLPPLHFSERLPKMAGPSHPDSQLIVAATRKSAEVAIRWHERTLEDLVDMEKWLRKYDRKYKKAVSK
jgi:hypothetical protein